MFVLDNMSIIIPSQGKQETVETQMLQALLFFFVIDRNGILAFTVDHNGENNGKKGHRIITVTLDRPFFIFCSGRNSTISG